MQRPIVGVMGSGDSPCESRADPLGRWLARQGVHLLTGGGGGVMAAVSKAFHETPGRGGLVIGIIPSGSAPGRPREGYPNPWVEVPIFTHLPVQRDGTDTLSRNHINVLSAAVIVALPGAGGTASEVRLARSYGRAVIAFLDSPDEIPDLPPDVPVGRRLEEVQAFVRAHLAEAARSGSAR